MIIPELEEAAKTYTKEGVTKYTEDQDDTILRYWGRVKTKLLLKHLPGISASAIRGRYQRLQKKRVKLADGTMPLTFQPEQGGKKPPEKVKAVKKKPASKRHGNLQIPFSTLTEKSQYQMAWKLCKKHGGIPYPKALELEERATSKETLVKPASPGPVPGDQKPATPAAATMCNDAATKDADPQQVPVDPQPVPRQDIPDPKQSPRPVILGLGTKVKHKGPKSSPFYGKEGTIVKMGTGTQVLVNFGDSSQWLAASSVSAIAG